MSYRIIINEIAFYKGCNNMEKSYKKNKLVFIFILLTGILFASASSTVYVTPSGKKYHRQNCRTLSRSKTVISLSIDSAKSRGYTPCKVCNP